MKNQLLKLRKAEGFVSIETIMIAAIMVLAGLVAYNVLYADTLSAKVSEARGMLFWHFLRLLIWIDIF